MQQFMQRIFSRPLVHRFIASRGRRTSGLRMAGWYHAHVSPNGPDALLFHPGETVCYVGTYRPERVAQLADTVGPEGRVVIVEAHPSSFEKLRQGVERLPCARQVVLINKALYKREGTVTFGVYEGDDRVEHHLIQDMPGAREYEAPVGNIDVEATTFDRVFDQYPAIRHVFVTINGAEFDALEGMRNYFSTPGCSAWIKSPFSNATTGRPMALDVAEVLQGWGLQTFVSGADQAVGASPMGKVFAFRPCRAQRTAAPRQPAR